MNRRIAIMVVFCCLFPTGPALAEGCRLWVAPLDFGAHPSYSSGAISSEAEIVVECEKGLPYAIKLDSGRHGRNSPASRAMKASPRQTSLSYKISDKPFVSEIWGDGTSSSKIVTGVGSGRPQTYKVYGKSSLGRNQPTGLYQDVIKVVLEWGDK